MAGNEWRKGDRNTAMQGPPPRAPPPREQSYPQRAWLNVQRTTPTADWKQKTPEGRRLMKERYKYIMKEVDQGVGSFISGRKGPFQFMDVCCCPGGFSEYVLVTAPQARGVGLSLNTELGGHIPSLDTVNILSAVPMSCPLTESDRYHMYFTDVTTIAHQLVCKRMSTDPEQQATAPFRSIQVVPHSAAVNRTERNQCDLMILDGSFLGGKANIYMEVGFKNDQENPAFNVYTSHIAANEALLMAQLAIMAWNAKDGADVVLRMSMTFTHFSNSVLALLRRVFRDVIENYKPRSCHQDKISYYLVCRSFNLQAAEELEMGQRLSDAVQALRRGGQPPQLVPFPMLPEGNSITHLYNMWGLVLQVYHLPLWTFRKLCDDANLYPNVNGRIFCAKPCWKHLVFRASTVFGCTAAKGMCKEGGHSEHELHPFVKVAFAQVNGHLFLPVHNGSLVPGQGHPRNEQNAVLSTLVEWSKKLVSMTMRGGTLEGLSEQVAAMAEMSAFSLYQQVWPHVLHIATNQEASLFRTMNLTTGGAMADSHLMTIKRQAWSAQRILQGPIPGREHPISSALDPPNIQYSGAVPYCMLPVGEARMDLPHQLMNLPGVEQMDLDAQEGWQQNDLPMAADELGDTFGTEMFGPDTLISGYHQPFMSVEPDPEDQGFSQQALIDFLGG